MNSEVLIVDTSCVERSAMHAWWRRHKEVVLYPGAWPGGAQGDNVVSKGLTQFILDNIVRGVLVITEDESLRRTLRRYFENLQVQSGGICCGDAILYDTPLASIEHDDLMWWATDEEVDNVAREFVTLYGSSSNVN